MNEAAKDRLYNLLPATYRICDVQQGEPLRALLRVIEEEMLALEKDIDGLYDDWFIETCSEWVIPYIGDLLDIKNVRPISSSAWSLRSYVANALAYRRRKGTAGVLEQMSRDVTGWPAHVVEFFEQVATTQHLNHLRLDNLQTPDLHKMDRLELLGGPFGKINHTVDVSHIAGWRGKYNIPNLGIFLWRLQSYPIGKNNNVLNRLDTINNTWGTARKSEELDGGYRFDPTGRDIQLFNLPQIETSITHLSEEINVPGVLRRICLYEDLEKYRKALAKYEISKTSYFGKQPVLGLALISEEGIEEINPEEIVIGDLSTWSRPPSEIKYLDINDELKPMPIRAAVDPLRGRLSLAEGITPKGVLVNYSYGFSGDVGAGPYDRFASIRESLRHDVDWQVGVTRNRKLVNNKEIFGTIRDALKEWDKTVQGWGKDAADKVCLIAIMDSRTYSEDLILKIPEAVQLSIIAAGWPECEGVNSSRQRGLFTARAIRPHLQGDIRVYGTADAGSSDPGELVIDGLLIEGKVTVQEGNLGVLRIAHSTLVYSRLSGESGIEVLSDGPLDNDSLELCIERTICGKVELAKGVSRLVVAESILDGDGSMALVADGTVVRIEKSTILGKTRTRTLEASNSIFTGRVEVEQEQEGCIRFCYLPLGPNTPRRFRCQPDLVLKDRTGSEKEGVLCRTRPAFTSLRYGDPGYVQLSLACAEEIRTGAEDGSEMGAFNSLQQPQREANLRAALEEYLPFGLEAGIFYMT